MGKGTETLDAVSASLVAQGVGQITASATDWFIVQGFSQDGPGFADRQIIISEYGGVPPLNRWAITYPKVQVVVRGKTDDYQAVREKIQDVFNALHEQEGYLSPPAFVWMKAIQSGPIPMGMDEKKRVRLGWNFESMRNTPGT